MLPFSSCQRKLRPPVQAPDPQVSGRRSFHQGASVCPGAAPSIAGLSGTLKSMLTIGMREIEDFWEWG